MIFVVGNCGTSTYGSRSRDSGQQPARPTVEGWVIAATSTSGCMGRNRCRRKDPVYCAVLVLCNVTDDSVIVTCRALTCMQNVGGLHCLHGTLPWCWCLMVKQISRCPIARFGTNHSGLRWAFPLQISYLSDRTCLVYLPRLHGAKASQCIHVNGSPFYWSISMGVASIDYSDSL